MALPWPIAYKIWLIDSCLYSGCVIWIRGLHFGCFFWMLEFYFNWCSLQKMLMLIRKSDSSTFCLSTADQFHSLSWGQQGLEMNLSGHDPTLRSNAGWHLWHKSTRPSYLHTIQTPLQPLVNTKYFLSGGWLLDFSRSEERKEWVQSRMGP